jgi:hypothetical protein
MKRSEKINPAVFAEAVDGPPIKVITAPGAAIDAKRISHPSIIFSCRFFGPTQLPPMRVGPLSGITTARGVPNSGGVVFIVIHCNSNDLEKGAFS